MTGPTVPVTGPEDGAACRCGHAKSEHRKFPCGLGCTVTEGDYWADSCTDFRSVVADTTAGEAEDIAAKAWRDGFKTAQALLMARVTFRADTAAAPAARSGGAQDDGLRARIEALVGGMERWQVGDSFVTGDEEVTAMWAQCLRRALAGPDDARQDGVG